MVEAIHLILRSGIVAAVQLVEVGPCMHHMSLLRVILAEICIKGSVEATLVAVAPKEDAGMVHVALHHLLNQLVAHLVTIAVLPSCQLVEVEQSEGVAEVEKIRVWWVVRAHSVHIHLFDETHIQLVQLAAHGASRPGVEAMAVRTLHQQLRVVEVQPVMWAELYGAESDALLHLMQRLAVFRQEAYRKVVEVRVLCIP